MNRCKRLLAALTLALAACAAPSGSNNTPAPASPSVRSAPDNPGTVATPDRRAPVAPAAGTSTSTAAATPDPGTSAPTAAVGDSLAALQGLNYVSVQHIIEDLPAEAIECYGPCPGYEEVIEKAREKARARAAKLAAVASSLPAAKSAPETCEPAAIEANLEALRGLRIVSIAGFVEAEPTGSPSCYVGPCPPTPEMRAETCERAAQLAALADAAKGL